MTASKSFPAAEVAQLTVGDLMTEPPIAVSADARLSVADRLLRVHGSLQCPSLTAGGALVGIVSRTDIRRASLGSLGAAWAGQRVSRVMTSSPPTINAESSPPDAAAQLEAHDAELLVVVDEEGKALGIFSTADVIHARAIVRSQH